jgi:hypothetical protein
MWRLLYHLVLQKPQAYRDLCLQHKLSILISMSTLMESKYNFLLTMCTDGPKNLLFTSLDRGMNTVIQVG